ncbi:tetratricopeptide repeat protein [Geovibrio ferrireducens]|uniref:tetratricopeptide repeat protein n=1 Tax=Geovibrio ferrireducens TaxID=46201 RepID=UPI0022482C7B|nr:tetratricopeptide repeat protein [Geovibrio ferrireducens]
MKKLLIILLSAVSVSVYASDAEKGLTAEARTAYNKAHGFYEKGENGRAEEAVREYRKQFPDAPHGLHSMLMGNICLKKQDKKCAMREFEDSAVFFGDNTQMWENAALLAYENKEYKKAEQLLNRLAALTSLNMQQKKILLSVYFADQQWGKAASVITPAEFKGMDDSDAKAVLAATFRAGRKDAFYSMLKGRIDATQNPEWWKYYAAFALEDGKTKEGVSAMRTYARTGNIGGADKVTAAKLLARAKVYDEAAEFFGAAMNEVRLECRDMVFAGNVSRKAGQFENSIKIFDKAVASGCSDKALSSKAVTYFMKKDYGRAAETFAMASEKEGNRSYGSYMAGLSYYKAGDKANARRFLRMTGKNSEYGKRAMKLLEYMEENDDKNS